MFGVVAPVGYCMVAVALGTLAAFLVLVKRTGPGQTPPTQFWAAWSGQFLLLAVFSAWLVHQIF